MLKLLPTYILCFLFAMLYAQKDSLSLITISHQQNYYTDYSDLLNLKAFGLYKLNNLIIRNSEDELLLNPNSPIGLGVSFNYKFLGFSLGMGLPHSASSIHKYGKTQRIDFQISVFMKNIGLDGHAQIYKGYYNANPGDFMEWEEDYFPKLPDMRTISIGVSGYYVFNNKRYSIKAAVARTQKQNRSSGSPLLGVFVNFDESNSPNGFFPSELPDSIGMDFDLNGFRYFATGISLGYAYTWIISKSFFLNGSLIPGGGYKDIRVQDVNGISDVEKQIHAQLALRLALGYEHKLFYVGLSASTLIRNIKHKSYDIDLATKQIRFYIGKRFDVSKK